MNALLIWKAVTVNMQQGTSSHFLVSDMNIWLNTMVKLPHSHHLANAGWRATLFLHCGVPNGEICHCVYLLTQILEFSNHVVSFVQVRGSVPLFWSQTGIKYKPPPRIDRGCRLVSSVSLILYTIEPDYCNAILIVNFVFHLYCVFNL